MSELVVNSTEEKTELYVLENNVICELYSFHKESENVTGNIYCGVVKNVVDGMQAAFVDIGMNKNAFISLKDSIPKVDITREEQNLDFKISSVLKENQKILVQVKKMPQAEKGARVSTHITIPGDYVVLMPNVEIITISQKIMAQNEKERLLTIAKKTLPQNYGLIIRTDAENVSDEKIVSDIKDLIKKWEKIKDDYQNSKKVMLLYDEHEIVSKIGRELITQKLQRIYCNNNLIYQGLKDYITQKGLTDHVFIELKEEVNLAEGFGLSSQIADSKKKKVWLKSGGYIVIDKTEALTAIDVNSGKYVGNANLESTALEVNKEAAHEIMRQIRLRDISGIIVVDYIDLQNTEDQAEIVKIMREEATKDRSKIDIKGYTKLNLVELTRKMSNL